MSSILTSTGKWFDVLKPLPEHIEVSDVAHALSNLCRFGGHSITFYSVAEHSILVSKLIAHRGGSLDNQRWGLLHDASEAYVADLPRPVKQLLPMYHEIEDRVQEAVARKYGLPWPIPDEVHQADNDMLAIELRAYMPKQPANLLPDMPDDAPSIWRELNALSSEKSRAGFLARAAELGILPDQFHSLGKRYPLVLRALVSTGPATEFPISCFGFQCEPGWIPLIDELLAWLEERAEGLLSDGMPIDDLPLVVQCKEKSGSLRLRAENLKNRSWAHEFYDRLEAARIRSLRLCDVCGASTAETATSESPRFDSHSR